MSSYKRLPTCVSKLLQRQNGFCLICKSKCFLDSVMEVEHLKPKALGEKDRYNNLQLLHKHCHIRKTRIDNKEIAIAKSN